MQENMDRDSETTQPKTDLPAPVITEEQNHHSTIPLEKNKDESITIEEGEEEERERRSQRRYSLNCQRKMKSY